MIFLFADYPRYSSYSENDTSLLKKTILKSVFTYLMHIERPGAYLIFEATVYALGLYEGGNALSMQSLRMNKL